MMKSGFLGFSLLFTMATLKCTCMVVFFTLELQDHSHFAVTLGDSSSQLFLAANEHNDLYQFCLHISHT